MRKILWLSVMVAFLLLGDLQAQSFYHQPAQLASFGAAMTMSGDQLFISEPSGFNNPGTVHVYEMVAGEWQVVEHIRASDSSINDGFGAMVASGEDRLLVAGQGGIYFFERPEAAWIQTMQIEGQATTLAIHGDMALVGTLEDQNNGVVTLYLRVNDEWTQADVMTHEKSGYGRSVALNAETAMVGSYEKVDFYSVGDGSLELTAQFTREGMGLLEDHHLGLSINLEGDHAAVVAYKHGSRSVTWDPAFCRRACGESTGVFLFSKDSDGNWEPTTVLPAAEGRDSFPLFGIPVQITSDGVWVASSSQGRVHLYSSEGTLLQSLASSQGYSRGWGKSFVAGDGVVLVGFPGAAYGEGNAEMFVDTDSDEWVPGRILYSTQYMLDSVSGDGERCDAGSAAGFSCSQVDLVSFLPLSGLGTNPGVRLNDVWGWTDPETGKEYALVGHLEGTAFVDVSNPSLPVFLGELPRTEGTPGSTWRDIKVYQDHAFIVADGADRHGMQVFDLTRLRNVSGEPVVFDVDALYTRIHSAHNIVINEETGYAFAVGVDGGGRTCGGGLHMINIHDPQSPEFAGCFADPSTGRSKTGYSHDAQCVIYDGPDAEYQGREICFGANETAISIADITDKENPEPISSGSYPGAAYVHQGWLSEDHGFFYQNDELDEISQKVDRTRTLVWDVRDLDDPILINEYFGPTSATDHNLYVRGDLMYQTNNASGLRIIDISDRGNPKEVGFFDTTPNGVDEAGFDGTWSSYPFFESGIIIVTSRREGLFILKKQSVGS